MIVLSLSTFPKHLNLHNIDKRKLSQPIPNELCMSHELVPATAAPCWWRRHMFTLSHSLSHSIDVFSQGVHETERLYSTLQVQNGKMCILSTKDGVMNKNTATVCVSWFVEQI